MATASGTHRDGKSIFRSASIRAVSPHFIVLSAFRKSMFIFGQGSYKFKHRHH